MPLPRIAYVNGRYLCPRDACVSIEDRGYQFADGQKVLRLERVVLDDGKEMRIYGR